AADFAPSLARWLQSHSKLPVQLALAGDILSYGRVLLAGTDDHLVLRPDYCLDYTADPGANPYRPSVDVFFGSLAVNCNHPGIAVLLTGMGCDGAQGLLELRRRKWHTIAQDKASSVVYRMPRAAADINAAAEILSLARIPNAVLAHSARVVP